MQESVDGRQNRNMEDTWSRIQLPTSKLWSVTDDIKRSY